MKSTKKNYFECLLIVQMKKHTNSQIQLQIETYRYGGLDSGCN